MRSDPYGANFQKHTIAHTHTESQKGTSYRHIIKIYFTRKIYISLLVLPQFPQLHYEVKSPELNMSEEVEAEVPPEELDKDFVVVADNDETEEDGKGGGKAMKKFQWRKLTGEDSIYTKGGGGGSSNMNQNHYLSSQGRWKKSALLERKPKDIDHEGTTLELVLALTKELAPLSFSFQLC